MHQLLRQTCLLGWGAVCVFTSVLAQPAQTEPFEAQRAMSHVIALAGPGKRPAASERARHAATYIKHQFEACGLTAVEHPFPMLSFDEIETRLSVVGTTEHIPAEALLYSPSGHLSAEVVAVPNAGRVNDFGNVDLRGKIALVQRGGIRLREKALAAARAGALAVLIHNTNPEPFLGTLGEPVSIPALALSGRAGTLLLESLRQGPLTLRLDSDTLIATRTGINIVATRAGASPKTIVLGAHYDTVTNSPGANDNASGTAVLLELARILAQHVRPETFQFIAFDGEEEGLLGSREYVRQLSPNQRMDIQVMINLDELGAGDRPYAFDGETVLVQKAIRAAKHLGKEAHRMDSGAGSDHASFAEVGIPVLFMFREDPLFHTPQDTPDRVKPEWLEAAGRIVLEVLAH